MNNSLIHTFTQIQFTYKNHEEKLSFQVDLENKTNIHGQSVWIEKA